MSFVSEAIVMRDIGASNVLEIRDFELPWPGNSDDVLVRIEAAGINPADTFFGLLAPIWAKALEPFWVMMAQVWSKRLAMPLRQ